VLHNAVLLDGWMTTEGALARLEPFGNDAYVVIRTRNELKFCWFSHTKAEIIEACDGVERSFGKGAQTPIATALGLKNSQARNAYDQRTTSSENLRTVSGVLVNGRQMIGVLTRDESSNQAPAIEATVAREEPSNKLTAEELVTRMDEETRRKLARAILDGKLSTQSQSRPGRSEEKDSVFARVCRSILGKNKDKAESSGDLGELLGGIGKDSSSSGSLLEVLVDAVGKQMTSTGHSDSGGTRGSASTSPEQPNASAPEPDASTHGPPHQSAGSEPPPTGLPENPRDSDEASVEPPDDAEESYPGYEGGKTYSNEPGSSRGSAGTVKDDVVYPKIDAPDRVDINLPFDFVVSLTREIAEARGAASIALRGVTEASTFTLHMLLSAPGFTVDGSSLRKFSVDRKDYANSKETFKLTPTDVLSKPSVQTIHVQFFYKGNPVGDAFQEVAVGATPDEKLSGGSTRMSEGVDHDPPDLTVFVNEANQSGYLAWTLQSPHPLDESLKQQVDIKLGHHNSQSFSVMLLKDVPGRDHKRALLQYMRGSGRQIYNHIPKNFWQALSAVWKALEPGKVPRILLVSTDPYIPWELAYLENDCLDESLLDPSLPSFLCAHVVIGRWLSMASDHVDNEHPRLPPPVKVRPDKMAVIVGDYLAKNGIRPLPEATKEGETLLRKYNGIELNAVEDDIFTLLENDVQDNGQKVDVSLMHFACHGKFDPSRPHENGIILNDNTRFDPVWAEGNRIGKLTRPFAFMNACEVGASTQSLGGYGGFAGAFIKQGFSGFMAPLWAVNDTDARQFALGFYQKTLEENVTVGEALRQLRAGMLLELEFDSDDDNAVTPVDAQISEASDSAAGKPKKPASTFMSYVLYAHPDLRLKSNSPGD